MIPVKAYLEITMDIEPSKRPAAADVYTTYKETFLSSVKGALSKDLLIRDEDVQVLHGFGNEEEANAYLSSELFQKDVFTGLKNLLKSEPNLRIYSVV